MMMEIRALSSNTKGTHMPIQTPTPNFVLRRTDLSNV